MKVIHYKLKAFLLATLFFLSAAVQAQTTYYGTSAGTTGTDNSFFGAQSGYSNKSSGNYNAFFGYEAGYANTKGSANAFTGTWAGFSNTTGSNNTFDGIGAGYTNTTGSDNVFIGNNSGNNNTGFSNSFLGNYSGYNNEGSDNVFLGDSAGYTNTTGSANVFIGTSAGQSNTTGYGNVFSGAYAGVSNIGGAANVFEGYAAGLNNTNSTGNVFEGYYAGLNDTGGADNIFIGIEAGFSNINGSNNVFTGVAAGFNNTSYSNSFYGAYSGYSNTTGYRNVFIGDSAGLLTTTGSYNLFIGSHSGVSNTTGDFNAFEGAATGFYNTTGSDNVFNGVDAGEYNTTGNSNVYNGYAAGYSNSHASGNVFDGFEAGFSDTGGIYNVFTGYEAGLYNLTGSHDVFSGTNAGTLNTTGSNNVFSGYAAGYNNTSGYSNAFYGNYAGYSNTTSPYNSFFGDSAGYKNTGSHNSFFGNAAGYSNTTGNHNTLIGDSANVGSASLTNATAIGNGAKVSQSNAIVLGNGSANVGIGISKPNSAAILDLTSTTQGLLVPRMTTTERKTISSPATGLQVYDNTLNQLYVYNGTSWAPFSGTSYTAGGGVTISGTSISADSNTAVWNANKLEGTALSSTSPTSGQVLEYNSTSSKWVPTTLASGTSYTAGGGVTISGSKISADSNTAVWNANKLEGTALSSTSPTSGQVLEYNSTSSKWVPTTLASGTSYTAGGGVTISGSKISADSNTAVWNANKLEGTALSSTSPTSGQVLEYNSTASKWEPTTLSGGTSYTAGGGVTISGSKISADSNTAVWNANKIQGKSISAKSPSNNQVLKYNNGLGEWTAATDTGIYTGSNGVSISGTTISGAYTGSNGVSVSGSTISGNYSAGGGVTISGAKISADSNTAVWNANKLEGTTLSSTSPTNAQVLQYSSSTGKWAPATLSGGSSYTAGGGVTISGSKISADSNNAVWNAAKLQGKNISATAPANKQVLKWNGANWTPANDSTTTYTGSNGVSVSGTTISGSYTGGTGISISGSTINSSWTTNGNNLSNNNPGNIGIGKTNPNHGLDAKNGVNTDSAYFIKGNEVLSTNSSYTDAMAIGTGASVAKSNSIVLGNSSTQVGIGSITAPGYTLQLGTNSAAKPGSATWTIASDARLKTNITPYTDGLDVLNQINPVWFQYSGEAGMPTGQKFVGVLAQDIQKIAPYMVGTWNYQDNEGNKTNYLDYDANSLFYILVNSVKAQQQQIVSKDSVINTQQQQISVLQQQMNEVLNRIAQVEQCTNCNPANTTQNNIITNTPATLDQNVPNPFSQNTVIGYFVPEITKSAYITINTLQGNQIQSFVISSTGKGQIMLSSGVLAAGDYIYTLVVDGVKIDSKKMMIVKD